MSTSLFRIHPVAIWIIALLALAVGLSYFVLRPIVAAHSSSLPSEFPNEGFSHRFFEELLSEYVHDGRVDYESWQQNADSRKKLSLYLGAVAAYSPDNAPERFKEEGDDIAYWMYAYNALVISAILDRWPLESVTDVKAPIEVVQGLGFFYKLKFVCGGETLSLYDIEHKKVLKKAQDPRVHFVLNCGSGSCPTIRPKLPTGAELGPYLAEAAAEFVAADENVEIDHKKKTVTVSKIFDWYEDDFLAELRRRGLPTEKGVLAYLPLIAEGERKAELESALDYKVLIRDYDWSVNSVEK